MVDLRVDLVPFLIRSSPGRYKPRLILVRQMSRAAINSIEEGNLKLYAVADKTARNW